MGPHIHGQRDNIHVSGTLSVAKQGGLNPLRTGQQTHFSSRHTAAPVIVGVEGDDSAVPAGQLTDKVFDLVGKIVGHTVLHSGGQVQDNLLIRRGVQMLQHRLADLHGIVHFGSHEGLGGILKAQVHARLDHGLGHLVDEVSRVGGNLGDAGHIRVEYHLTLEGRGGVIKMQDHVFRALDGLKGLFDQMIPGLDQNLDGHVVGDMAAVNEFPADFIFGFRGGREANLDLFHADVQQGMEIFQLFLQIHGVYQGLVAVPQIDGAPDGSLGDLTVRPGAVGKGDGLEGNVLFKSGFHRSFLLWKSGCQSRKKPLTAV